MLDNKLLEVKNLDELKQQLFFERECIYLDCTYSEHILNIYFSIQEYLNNRGSSLIKNMKSIDLEELIIQHSSLYDVYYESDEENDNSDCEE